MQATLPLRSSGTHKGLREKLPWPKDRPFRILTIDGGGIRGILPAAILTQFERLYLGGNCIGKCFDLIAGTSTGGIIALALATGRPASSILKLYMEHGEEVFPAPAWPFNYLASNKCFRAIRSSMRYVYNRDPLERQLELEFGSTLFGEATVRLCVPAFDENNEVTVLKTPHHPDFRIDWKDTIVEQALKTSAAPTFFSAYHTNGRRYLDGGVWANNPIMIGLVDALTCNDLQSRQIHILSIGSAEIGFRISEKMLIKSGILHWYDVFSATSHLQSQNAIGQAGLLIGRDHLTRIDAEAKLAEPIFLDDYKRASGELPAIAESLANEFGSAVHATFLTNPTVPYQAFHGPRA